MSEKLLDGFLGMVPVLLVCALLSFMAFLAATVLTDQQRRDVARDCEMLGAFRVGDRAFVCAPDPAPDAELSQ